MCDLSTWLASNHDDGDDDGGDDGDDDGDDDDGNGATSGFSQPPHFITVSDRNQLGTGHLVQRVVERNYVVLVKARERH